MRETLIGILFLSLFNLTHAQELSVKLDSRKTSSNKVDSAQVLPINSIDSTYKVRALSTDSKHSTINSKSKGCKVIKPEGTELSPEVPKKSKLEKSYSELLTTKSQIDSISILIESVEARLINGEMKESLRIKLDKLKLKRENLRYSEVTLTKKIEILEKNEK